MQFPHTRLLSVFGAVLLIGLVSCSKTERAPQRIVPTQTVAPESRDLDLSRDLEAKELAAPEISEPVADVAEIDTEPAEKPEPSLWRSLGNAVRKGVEEAVKDE